MSFSPRTEYSSNHLHYRVLRNGWTQSFTERQQPPAFLIPEGPVNGRCLFLGRHTRRFVKMRTTRAPTFIQQTLTGFVLPLYDVQRIRGPNDRRIQMQNAKVYHLPAGETTSGHRRQPGFCASLRPALISPSCTHFACLARSKVSLILTISCADSARPGRIPLSAYGIPRFETEHRRAIPGCIWAAGRYKLATSFGLRGNWPRHA